MTLFNMIFDFVRIFIKIFFTRKKRKKKEKNFFCQLINKTQNVIKIKSNVG